MLNLVLDTNATWDYVQGVDHNNIEAYAIKRARQLDSMSIYMLISPIVIMELLSHLEDVNDKKYNVSFKALKAIMLTNKYQRIMVERYMLRPADLLIAEDLFGMKLDCREAMYQSFMIAAHEISLQSIDTFTHPSLEDGTNLSDFVHEQEKAFVTEIRGLIKRFDLQQKGIDEQLQGVWIEYNLAMFFIRIVYQILHAEGKIVSYNHKLFKEKAYDYTLKSFNHCSQIVQRYPCAIAMMKRLVKMVVISNVHDDRLYNYLWDIMLLFHVTDQRFVHNNIIFLTQDSAMLKSSEPLQGASIMTWKQFVESPIGTVTLNETNN